MGWRWFAGWALAAGLLLFAFLTGFSIGLFVMPVALAVLVLVARRARVWPESLGALAGAGAVCVVVAALNWTAEADGGAPNPVLWLASGVLLMGGGAAFFAAARRHDSVPPGVGGRP